MRWLERRMHVLLNENKQPFFNTHTLVIMILLLLSVSWGSYWTEINISQQHPWIAQQEQNYTCSLFMVSMQFKYIIFCCCLYSLLLSIPLEWKSRRRKKVFAQLIFHTRWIKFPLCCLLFHIKICEMKIKFRSVRSFDHIRHTQEKLAILSGLKCFQSSENGNNKILLKRSTNSHIMKFYISLVYRFYWFP
jgi:hypothetical protein